MAKVDQQGGFVSDTEVYAGSAVTLSIYGPRCIHSRHSVLGKPDVWVSNIEGAWVHPDAAPAEVIAAIAQRSPSGFVAIVAELHLDHSCEV